METDQPINFPKQSIVPAAEQIDRIMANFDFNKVRGTMRKLSLVWYHYDQGDLIPSIEKMKDTVLFLLKSIDPTSPYCAVGGFIATIDRFGAYNLFFSVAEMTGDPLG